MQKILERKTYKVTASQVFLIDINGNTFKQVTRALGIGADIVDYEPAYEVPEGYLGWFYDGTDVVVNGQRYKVRDRMETHEEYEALSR